MDDFSPLELLERSLRFWWLIVLSIVCGGGVGWLIHTQQPPIYEARVVFYTAIDYKQTGKIDLLAEDRAIGLVGDVIASTPVMAQVVEDARAQGISTDTNALYRMAFIGRRAYQWELRLRNPDPGVAQILANLWADRAFAALKEDYRHAVQAASLRSQLDDIYLCSVAMPTQLMPAYCQSITSDQLKQAADELVAAYQNEMTQSGGMSAALLFDLTNHATRPAQPVVLGRNSVILAGGFIGFVLAIWAISADWPRKLPVFLRRARQNG